MQTITCRRLEAHLVNGEFDLRSWGLLNLGNGVLACAAVSLPGQLGRLREGCFGGGWVAHFDLLRDVVVGGLVGPLIGEATFAIVDRAVAAEELLVGLYFEQVDVGRNHEKRLVSHHMLGVLNLRWLWVLRHITSCMVQCNTVLGNRLIASCMVACLLHLNYISNSKSSY
jgi:hypothetical protein